MADQQEQPQQPASQEEMDAARGGGLNLPPGFRFHPSDDEIICDYLSRKVLNRDFTCTAIGEADLNKTEPWELPRKATMGEKEWYFFYQKDRKYPTGMRANRATEGGYWKATGKDKEIYRSIDGVLFLVSMKKTLVFYKGRAPRGDKTNWVMHEYRLEGSVNRPCPASVSSSAANAPMKAAASSSASISKDDWVVCRVFHKTSGIKKAPAPAYQVPMANNPEVEQNQNNIPVPAPMPMPPLPLPMPPIPPMPPMPMQFLPDFVLDPMGPYYPNAGVGPPVPPIMPQMAGIVGGAAGLHQINGALFGNPMAAPPPMPFYNQMGMDSHPSSMVSQRDTDHQANAAEISSMMSVAGPGSATTTLDMEAMWDALKKQ